MTIVWKYGTAGLQCTSRKSDLTFHESASGRNDLAEQAVLTGQPIALLRC
jgi:hypothetical protein